MAIVSAVRISANRMITFKKSWLVNCQKPFVASNKNAAATKNGGIANPQSDRLNRA